MGGWVVESSNRGGGGGRFEGHLLLTSLPFWERPTKRLSCVPVKGWGRVASPMSASVLPSRKRREAPKRTAPKTAFTYFSSSLVASLFKLRSARVALMSFSCKSSYIRSSPGSTPPRRPLSSTGGWVGG